MKVPNNKISSVKSYFLESLKSFSQEDVNNYFSFLCDAWLDLTKADLLLNPDVEIAESELLKFLYAIKDLKKNRTIQYIAGKTWFYGVEVKVQEGVLIPRPETEELVDWIVNDCQNSNRILDLGTGSGCIPLAIKNKLRHLNVVGYDVSKKAVNIAKKNANSLCLDVDFQEFDILNWQLFPQENKFDVIVSNPPYVLLSELKKMNNNVVDFEPHIALFVDDSEPLFWYKIISIKAKRLLNKDGHLYFEINENYGSEVISILDKEGFVDIELKKDINDKDRMVKAVWK